MLTLKACIDPVYRSLVWLKGRTYVLWQGNSQTLNQKYNTRLDSFISGMCEGQLSDYHGWVPSTHHHSYSTRQPQLSYRMHLLGSDCEGLPDRANVEHTCAQPSVIVWQHLSHSVGKLISTNPATTLKKLKSLTFLSNFTCQTWLSWSPRRALVPGWSRLTLHNAIWK